MEGTMLSLRPLTVQDLSAVARLEQAAYPGALLEGEREFAEKLEAYPSGALGLFDGNALAAYLFCHPWTLNEVYALGSGRPRIPATPDCLYIHDLVVGAQYRGSGAASRLVEQAYAIARAEHLPACALVAVLGSETFWKRQGFEEKRRLDYKGGITGRYMIKCL